MFRFRSAIDRLKDFLGPHRINVPYRPQSEIEIIEPKFPRFDLSYPPAAQSRKSITQGKYRYGFPEGAVIHYNAGSNNVKAFFNYMRSMKYVTFLIDRKGHVWQDFPLDKWGHHAGRSKWGGYERTVHDYFVGIEIMSAGIVEKRNDGLFKSWFDTIIPSDEVRSYKGKYYHAFTRDQEKQLVLLLMWLEQIGQGVFKFENVVGHHEVSPGRKSDPGGALSMTMSDFRVHLRKEKGLRIKTEGE